jgi:hypothetical protein
MIEGDPGRPPAAREQHGLSTQDEVQEHRSASERVAAKPWTDEQVPSVQAGAPAARVAAGGTQPDVAYERRESIPSAEVTELPKRVREAHAAGPGYVRRTARPQPEEAVQDYVPPVSRTETRGDAAREE